MDFLDGVERMGALGPYKVTDDRGRAVLAGTVKMQDGWHPDAAAPGGRSAFNPIHSSVVLFAWSPGVHIR